MKDVDFSICPFIRDELSFITYFDFCKNSKILKAYYEALDINAKRFYKWFVYSNIHMTEYFKDLIWEYLNNNDPECYINLIENLSKYRER